MIAEPDACLIARDSLRSYFSGEVRFGPDIVPAPLRERAAAFVFLWSGDELRGCMGSLKPRMPTCASEIAMVAIQAATADPQRSPLHASELDALSIGVAILGEMRPLGDAEMVGGDEGIALIANDRPTGFALPGWFSPSQPEAAVAGAAGHDRDEPGALHAFPITPYGRVAP